MQVQKEFQSSQTNSVPLKECSRCHQNSFFKWELPGCFFPQSSWSLSQKREANRRNFRGAPGHLKRKERQRELLVIEVHACIFLP